MAALEPEVLEVGRARLAHTQPVQVEQHRQCSPLCMLICMRSTSVRIDVTTHEQLKRLAAELNTTVGNTVSLAVRALRQDHIATDLNAPLGDEEIAWLDADLG